MMLHTEYQDYRPCGFRQEHRTKPICAKANNLNKIWQSTTGLCCISNIKALSMMVSDMKIFIFSLAKTKLNN